ncbi:hypothetical protein [Streptomyces huasconensis]
MTASYVKGLPSCRTRWLCFAYGTPGAIHVGGQRHEEQPAVGRHPCERM